MSPSEPSLPTEDTPLRDYPWIVVRLRCHFCRRGGDYRLADIVAKHGPRITMGRIVVGFVGGCHWAPWNPTRKPQKYGMKCGGFCPDLRASRPPDLPPSMTGLTVVDGGRGDQLPAEPGEQPRRRRVGGTNDA